LSAEIGFESFTHFVKLFSVTLFCAQPVKAIKITIYIEDNKQIFFIINQTLHLLVFAKHCEFVYYCIPIKKTVQGLNL
jgi:hypothetical protein